MEYNYKIGDVVIFKETIPSWEGYNLYQKGHIGTVRIITCYGVSLEYKGVGKKWRYSTATIAPRHLKYIELYDDEEWDT